MGPVLWRSRAASRWALGAALWAAAGAQGCAWFEGDDTAGGDGGASSTDSGATDGPPAADGGPTAELTRFERYIRADGASRLVLELDRVEGYGPDEDVVPRLEQGLDDVVDKPDGVEVVQDGTIDSRGEDHDWTGAQLRELAEDTYDLEVPEDTAKMHVLFVDGNHADDGDGSMTLGLAWGHRHMVLFKRSIERACSGGALGPVLGEQLCQNAELSVWTHEVGHTLGLVDNGLPMVMDHRDDENGKHDESDECVMYWAYEGEAAVDLLRERLMEGDDRALGFDGACLDDIRAVREQG